MSRTDETLLDLALSRSTVDRSAHLRGDADALARAVHDPSTRVVALSDGRALVGDDGRLSRAATSPDQLSRAWFLGVDPADGATWFAVVGDPHAPAPDGARWASLREFGAVLDDTEAGLLTTATALWHWHDRHGHCPRCGAATEVVLGGWVRRCPRDGSEHHPRTDPAVIMAVTDPAERILLATGTTWPEGRMSVLAGFVEAGESLEAAVRREVAEEVGLEVVDLRYRGNQPWPFPASLMLGYAGRVDGTALTPDPLEISAARWFTRAELEEDVAAGRVSLPSGVSIARRLIEEWFGGELPDPAVAPR